MKKIIILFSLLLYTNQINAVILVCEDVLYKNEVEGRHYYSLSSNELVFFKSYGQMKDMEQKFSAFPLTREDSIKYKLLNNTYDHLYFDDNRGGIIEIDKILGILSKNSPGGFLSYMCKEITLDQWVIKNF